MPQPYKVKSKTLSEILCITQRRVNQLANEHVFKRDSKGQFDIKQAVPAYIQFISQEEDELRQEKILHERAKRRKAELEYEVRKGDLLEASEVEQVWTNLLVTFRNKSLALPSKLAPRVIGLENLAEIENVIELEVNQCLQELSEPTINELAGGEGIDEENEEESSEEDEGLIPEYSKDISPAAEPEE